jgi:hypothetical protein
VASRCRVGLAPAASLRGPPVFGCQAAVSAWLGLPPVAMAGSHRWPVPMMACMWRSSAAASAARACPVETLLCSRLVGWVHRAV